MIILNYTYKTYLSQKKINDWVKEISNERIPVFRIKRYVTKLTSSGFRIRERKLNKHQFFSSQIIGEYISDERRIKIRICPSVLGMILFGSLWFIAPVIIIFRERAVINGSLRTLELTDNLNSLGVLLLILIPMTLVFLIWPNFKARIWIEGELRLTDRRKR
ncbi:MAG: hypothetical protein N4A72_21845 [Bacteroidales bacterium]|jgi:hypothetical protein|nr:hypothetical protein [Bacteroidales bacterium]